MMDIQRELFKLKSYIIGALISFIAIFIFVHLLPFIISMITFYFPLLFSTALFAVVIFVLTKIVPPNNDPIHVPRLAEEILEYFVIAGNHQFHHPDYNNHPANHHHPENYYLPANNNQLDLPPPDKVDDNKDD